MCCSGIVRVILKWLHSPLLLPVHYYYYYYYYYYVVAAASIFVVVVFVVVVVIDVSCHRPVSLRYFS